LVAGHENDGAAVEMHGLEWTVGEQVAPAAMLLQPLRIEDIGTKGQLPWQDVSGKVVVVVVYVRVSVDVVDELVLVDKVELVVVGVVSEVDVVV